MKNSKMLKVILFYLGGNLVVIASWRLFDAIGFAEFNGISLGDEISGINEAKGAAGAIIAFGILIMLGAFNRKLSYTSVITASTLYLGFGVARFMSYIIDGYPGDMIMTGMWGELVLGLIGFFAFFRYRIKS
jgi:hypothetical protein